MSTTRNPVKAIRKHCLECVGGSSEEVRTCTGTDCNLHPFRFGKNPFSKKQPPQLTDEQKALRNERIRMIGRRNRLS